MPSMSQDFACIETILRLSLKPWGMVYGGNKPFGNEHGGTAGDDLASVVLAPRNVRTAHGNPHCCIGVNGAACKLRNRTSPGWYTYPRGLAGDGLYRALARVQCSN